MKTIKLFGAPLCGYCQQCKDFLEDKDMKYTYLDVTKGYMEEMLKLNDNLTSVPTLIDGEVIKVGKAAYDYLTETY